MIEIIIPKTPKVTTSCRHVIGLRGMGQGIILIEKNALTCETRKGGLEKMSRMWVRKKKNGGITVELADSKSVFSNQIWQAGA